MLFLAQSKTKVREGYDDHAKKSENDKDGPKF